MQLHPGLVPVLRKLDAHELDVAKMIRDGDLTSPWKFHNITFFNIRISGTGVAIRPSINENTFRRPENYLTEDFLQRCNGLPVIMHHPKESLLTSDEFADRVVGTVTLPYIRDDEVWAVVRIYDDEAIKTLAETQMSTSPAVLLSKSKKVKLEDGSELLVEGEPTLLDHIALCNNGVWDKGGEPTGVDHTEHNQIRKDSAMAEKTEAEMEKEKVDAARADEQFDELLKGIDSVKAAIDAANSRMDAMEKMDQSEDDPDEDKDEDESDKDEHSHGEDEDPTEARRVAADRRKADARVDSIRADAERRFAAQEAELKATRETLQRLESMIRQPHTDGHRVELTSAQARADSVMQQFGEEAPRFMVGETPRTYRNRLAAMMQAHSDKWKDIRLDSFDDAAFKVVEEQIYADAVSAARRPKGLEAGRMREITKRSPSGHLITEFHGQDSFVTGFRRPLRRVRAFNVGGAGR
jgi:hypothetical protein